MRIGRALNARVRRRLLLKVLETRCLVTTDVRNDCTACRGFPAPPPRGSCADTHAWKSRGVIVERQRARIITGAGELRVPGSA
jgi:hypothetical protein